MLDSDVAMLYHYETKNINRAMKRNIERFPEDFCFQLTDERSGKLEVPIWNLKFGTKKIMVEEGIYRMCIQNREYLC